MQKATTIGTFEMKKRFILVALATVLGVLLCGPAVAVDRPPDKLSQLPIDGVRLATDGRGNIVTYDPQDRSLVLWDRKGDREKSCVRSSEPGPMGLSEGHVVLSAFGEDKSALVSYDMRECRVVASRELTPFMVFGIVPARYGWLLRTTDLTHNESTFVLVDLELKTQGRYDIPKDAIGDAASASIFGRNGTPFMVDGEVWVVPNRVYEFWRPRQKGREEYSFFPPGCLAVEGHQRSPEDVRKRAQALAEHFKKDPLLGPLFRKRAEAQDPGISVANSIQAIATYRGWAAILVPKGTGCRIDVWDLNAEAPVAIVPLEDGCPRFFTFDDERLLIAGDDKLRTIPFKESLGLPIKEPCPKEKKDDAKTPASQTPAANDPATAPALTTEPPMTAPTPVSNAPATPTPTRAGHGGAGFIGAGAVAAAAGNHERVGVLVRTNRARSCRLDLWDTETHTLASSVSVPGYCPGFLALGEHQAWTFKKDGFQAVALTPATEPCSDR